MLIPWLLLALLSYTARLSLVVLSFSLVWLSYLGVLDSLGLGYRCDIDISADKI